jgi:RHS repeat-associated protein
MANISYRAASTLTNRYGWNGGNEYEDEGELNYSNTFYRKYDAQIGRFTGVDMLAEKFAGLTPYQFGGNNPVMFNDPMGDRMHKGEDGQYHADWYNDLMWGGGAGGTYGGYGSGGGGFGGGVGGRGGNYSAFWNNLWNSVPEGMNVKFNNAPVSNGTITGYYYGNQSGSGEYVSQTFNGSVTFAAGENYHYTGYIASVNFSAFSSGVSNGGRNGGSNGSGNWGIGNSGGLGSWGSGNSRGGGFGGLGTTIWQAGIPPANAAPAKDPLLKFVGFRHGFIPEFESRLMNGQGAFFAFVGVCLMLPIPPLKYHRAAVVGMQRRQSSRAYQQLL